MKTHMHPHISAVFYYVHVIPPEIMGARVIYNPWTGAAHIGAVYALVRIALRAHGLRRLLRRADY